MDDTPADGNPEPLVTERQREILILMAQGMGYKEIAQHMYLSTRTVERHAARAARALGAPSHVSLGAVAYEMGLLRPEHLTNDETRNDIRGN
ncbi:response regulator transcription factor [Glycomyces salinus]|uniref:response regulator transcription factor n=1 Tax=Glycomyces salinus TaxID=980294 RepID=UPI0018EA7B9A|nr:helix-turn-helix transcriptional regulator [Glycomyces salinus]